jgi:hypothetical protein
MITKRKVPKIPQITDSHLIAILATLGVAMVAMLTGHVDGTAIITFLTLVIASLFGRAYWRN